MDNIYGHALTFILGAGSALLWLYLGERVKNLAARADRGALTQLEEAAKQPFSASHQQLEHQQELRLAVLKERFKAHQEAWTLWLELVWTADDTQGDSLSKAVTAAQDWWTKNSLYLDAPVRQRFKTCISSANIYVQLMNPRRPRGAGDAERVKELWAQLHGTGAVIAEAVGLPAIVGDDTAKLTTEVTGAV